METQPSKLSLNSNNSMVAALMPNHSALYVLDQSIMPSELYLGQSQCPSPEVTTLQRLGLGLGLTLGVWTKVKIPSGTHFGPFIGKIRPLPLDRQYAWEIAQVTDVHGTTCSMWVDATEAGIGNWMKYVRTSSNSSMRNMKAVLLNSQVYYRATKDIHEGEELLLKDRKLIPCNQKSHSIHHHHHHHHHHHPEDITTTSSAPSTPTLGTTTDSTGGQPVSSHFSTYNNNNNNTKTTKESHTPSSTTSTTGQQPVQHQAKAEEHRTANDDVPSSCPPGAASSPTTTVAESALNQLDGTSRRVSSGCEGGGGGSEGPVFLGQKGGHSATRNCEATNNSNANTEEEEEEDDEEDLEEEEEEEDLEEEEEDDEEDEEEDLEEDDDEDRRPATHKSKSEDGKPLTSGLSVDSCESEFKQHFQQGLECAACCQTFGDVAKLEEHLVVVHYARESGLGEYKCGQCPKIFNWKSNLLRHQSTHEDGRRYSCENCHKIFTDPSNLQRHIRSQHIGARSHACSECGKTFATSSGLKQHTHIHSSVKPFQCEVCLKSYTQFSNLCRHKRMHADCRMQIKCHKCGQAFSTVTSLSKHKRFCEGPPPPAALVAHPNVVSPLTNGCGLLNLAGTGAATNDANVAPPPPMNLSHPAAQLMFYPRPGFSFYPPSMVAYPMFPGAASAIPPHPSLVAATANPLFVQTALTAKKPDSPDSSSVPGGATAANGSATVPPSPKVAEPTGHKEKRGSEGSDSDISDDVSSACDDIDLSTGSELDSESDADARQRDRSRRKSATSPKKLCTNNNGAPTNVMPNLFVPRRENSPKQGAVYPAEPTLKSSLHPGVNGLSKPLSVNCSDSAAVATDMPYDLSVNSKAPHMSPAAKPPAPEGSAGKDEEQPLDLRVDHKKSVSVAEGRHKTHVFGKDERAAPPMPPPEKPLPMIPAPTIAAPPPPVPAFAEPPPSSPTKFPMACPRPIHPLMIDALYRMDKPKFPAFQAPERLLPAFPPRYPFLSPLMNLNGSNAAFDLLRSQMEKMGKPYHDVLSPHMNKLKERYSCKFCGKIFPRSANLTRHLRTHTGEQPYKCKYCERSFSISSNLQRHVRNIHNKEKPFKCPLCDRCFGQQTNLDRHLKKHESDGPTILDDSPKSAELNDKDDTYFDEIRNFIGKVTERDTTALVAATSAHPPLTAAHLFDKLDCGAASANLPIPPDHHHHHHHHHHLRLNLGAIANERMTADKNPADEDDPDEKPPSVKRHRSSADSDLAESRSTTSPRTRKDGGETLVNGCKGLPCPKTMAYEVRMKVNKKYPEDEEEDDGDDAVDEYQRREVNRLVGGATESKPPQEKMVDV